VSVTFWILFVVIWAGCWGLAAAKMVTLGRQSYRLTQYRATPRCWSCGHFCAASEKQCANCRDGLQ